MYVGQILKINPNYGGGSECAGDEVCVISINTERAFPVEATVISGPYKGCCWLFYEEELS